MDNSQRNIVFNPKDGMTKAMATAYELLFLYVHFYKIFTNTGFTIVKIYDSISTNAIYALICRMSFGV